jgi:hypothetical protein
MSGRPSILICHTTSDKKWAERLQTALAEAASSFGVILWDETSARSQAENAPTFEEAHAEASLTLLLASPAFFESTVARSMKRPLLQALSQQRSRGVGLILVSHCVHELTWASHLPVLNGTDQPLDSINTGQREMVLQEVTEVILDHVGGGIELSEGDEEQDENANESEIKPAGKAHLQSHAGRTIMESPYARRLSTFIRSHKDTAVRLQQFTRVLLIVALASLGASFLFSMMNHTIVLLLIIAGFGLFAASLAFVFWAYRTSIEQKIVMARYLRTGFIDDTIPSRQRSALTRKADAMLGQF